MSPRDPRPAVASRTMIALLLLSSLLLGLAHIALLPPMEGFDELGHYSYIQQVADTGRWPRQGDKLSKDIEDYLKIAPTADAIAPISPWRYHGFFTQPEHVVAAAREAIHEPPAQPRTFVPGQIGNGIVQHPPLYYFALAPVYLATKTLSFASQLFIMRTFSYLLAWTALCIVAIAALSGKLAEARAAIPVAFAISAWPLLFPMWFVEMGRLGNNCLIPVFAACLFILAWRVTSAATLRHYALLGAVLGLALLTKATFLPASAAILAVLAIQALLARKTPGDFPRHVGALCVTVSILIGVCGWWYLQKHIDTGSAIGSVDVMQMHEAGGMIAGLKKNLRLDQLVMMPLGFAFSFLWVGTWSFVVPPRVFILPLMAIVALIACGVYRSMRRHAPRPVDWFSLLTLGLFVAALTYHSFVLLSIGAEPAAMWYMHGIAPILALLVGYGIFEVATWARLRGVLMALMLYPLPFLAAVTTMNALYFAGCAEKLPGRNYFARASATECLADFPRMLENLGVLAFPRTGIALFAIGWIMALAAMTMAIRALRDASYTSMTSTR
jgi:hypothetical protein